MMNTFYRLVRTVTMTVMMTVMMTVTFLSLTHADTVTHKIPVQQLRYAVSYGQYNAGEIEITIAHEGDGYTVTSNGKPSLLASLFLKSHYSQTHFVRDGDDDGNDDGDGDIELARGDERVDGKSVKLNDFVVDRARGEIKFSHGGVHPIKADDRLEAAVFPLLLMLRTVNTADTMDELAGNTVREVGFRRVRDYRYESPVMETVTVPAGTFASWKITRHRISKPADTVTVWLRHDDGDEDHAENPVPVKMSLHLKGTTSNFLLITVD